MFTLVGVVGVTVGGTLVFCSSLTAFGYCFSICWAWSTLPMAIRFLALEPAEDPPDEEVGQALVVKVESEPVPVPALLVL